MTDVTIEELVAAGFTFDSWECPSCKYLNPKPGGEWNWCGKNLQCPGCKQYHYYSEYTMVNEDGN